MTQNAGHNQGGINKAANKSADIRRASTTDGRSLRQLLKAINEPA